MHAHTPRTPTALIRFVTEGMHATIDSHLAGHLPLHRFTWELHTRIDTLAALQPPARTLTRLRWLQRTVEHLHTELAHNGRATLTGDEQNSLTVTLTNLRTLLATLTPHNPPDPTNTGHPDTGHPDTGHRAGALRVIARQQTHRRRPTRLQVANPPTHPGRTRQHTHSQ